MKQAFWKDSHPAKYCGHLLKIFCRRNKKHTKYRRLFETFKRKKNTKLKIELKRLACGKYLARYPNISTVCLVASLLFRSFFFLASLSISLSMRYCFKRFFKCKWKIVRRMRQRLSLSLLNYQRIEKQSIFDIQNEISVTKIRMQNTNGLFVCFEHRNCVYVLVCRPKESCYFVVTDTTLITFSRMRTESDSRFIWNWQRERIVWYNGMQPN